VAVEKMGTAVVEMAELRARLRERLEPASSRAADGVGQGPLREFEEEA
jgi:hypothetical protein